MAAWWSCGGCATAHWRTARCTLPRACHGDRHHAVRALERIAREDPDGTRRAIDDALRDIAEEEEDDDEGVVRARFERARLASVCDTATCPCACHMCTRDCVEEAQHLRARGGYASGIRAGDALEDVVPRLVAELRGVEWEPSEECGDAPRRYNEVDRELLLQCVGDVPPPTDDDGTAIVVRRVALRVDWGEVVHDTLLVSRTSDWCALRVHYGPGAALLFPAPRRGATPAFESYAGYVAFVARFGGSPYTRATTEQRAEVLATLRRRADGAVFDAAGADDAADASSCRRALPDVRAMVRRLHDHAARAETRSLAETVTRFVNVAEVAERKARDGAVAQGFDDLRREAKRARQALFIPSTYGA